MKIATAEQMRRMDQIAIHERGIPSPLLMERAAAGIVDAIHDLVEGPKPEGRQKVLYQPEVQGCVS